MSKSSQVKTFHKFKEAPLTSSKSLGHLRRYLETQSRGLSGNLEVGGYPFDTYLWAGKDIESKRGAAWWPYEQTGYWVDGFTRLGFLIGDKRLQKKAAQQVSYILKHADKDSYLGPKNCKEFKVSARWSHAVFFRAMAAYSSATGDKSIAGAIRDHYVKGKYEHSFHRDVCNVEAMCWAYGEIGDKRLIKMAEKTWQKFQIADHNEDLEIREGVINKIKPVYYTHGVTYMEMTKLGTILYLYTGKKKYLIYTQNAHKKLNKYHMLPDGIPSSSELLRTTSSLDAHELCDVADYTWNLGYLFMATGDAAHADRMEEACYNALQGQTTNDFKQHQYFSSSNQIVLGAQSSHTEQHTGTTYMCYRPKPGTECCTGQVARTTPNFVSRMWMMHKDGPAAVFYGPSSFEFAVNKTNVKITEETNYPFSDEIEFLIETERAVKFPFTLRIPGWCKRAEILINNKKKKVSCRAGTFITLKETFNPGDRITLKLPMQLKVKNWPDKGKTIHYGPLLFALPVKEKRKVAKDDKNQNKNFPAFNMYPDSDWNYALNLAKTNPEKYLQVEFLSPSQDPWTNPPIVIHVKGKKVKDWKMRKTKSMTFMKSIMTDPSTNRWEKKLTTVKGNFEMTPPLPDPKTLSKRLSKKEEELKLIPYGCTQLRIAMFPCYGR